MDNQHQKITGYRDLTETEIALMNRVKAHGEELEKLLDDVGTHLIRQRQFNSSVGEIVRIENAAPGRWLASAKTDLQVGLMKLTRAVAQPSSF